MTEWYEQTIEVKGRIYRYDPDSDCYYRCDPQAPETNRERWIKVVLGTIFLAIISVSARYFLHGTL